MNVDQSQHVQHHVPVDISDPAVIAKITEFHAELASLNPVHCSICVEKFPSILTTLPIPTLSGGLVLKPYLNAILLYNVLIFH